MEVAGGLALSLLSLRDPLWGLAPWGCTLRRVLPASDGTQLRQRATLLPKAGVPSQIILAVGGDFLKAALQFQILPV